MSKVTNTPKWGTLGRAQDRLSQETEACFAGFIYTRLVTNTPKWGTLGRAQDCVKRLKHVVVS